MAAEAQERLLAVSHSLEAFANFPGVAGCMTRMTANHPCGVHFRRLERLLVPAKQSLREDFAFVGIHEHRRETVCLFHRMFGLPVHPAEFEAGLLDAQGRSSDGAENTATPPSAMHHQRSLKADGSSNNSSWSKRGRGRRGRRRRGRRRSEPKEALPMPQSSLVLQSNAPTPNLTQVPLDAADDELHHLPPDEWRQLNRNHDLDDEKLYTFAVKIFVRNLELYGFKTPEPLI